MKNYIMELEYFIKRWYYSAFLLLIAVISFGFTTTHIAVNIDSLSGELYHSGEYLMISTGRFGMTFWTKLFCNGLYQVEDSFAIGIIGVLMLCFAAVNFCIVFRRASNDTLSMPAYIIFSGAFVSYPLINEIWEYNGMEIIIGGGYMFISISILLIYDQIEKRKFNAFKSLATIFMLTIVCSSYESLIGVYLFVVFAVLYFRELKEKNVKKHISEGLVYAGGLAVSLILRIAIHKILLAVMNLNAKTTGATEIEWFSGKPVIKVFTHLIKRIFVQHYIRSLLYAPLLIFVLCVVVFVIYTIYSLFKKRFFATLLMAGMLFSTELLSVIQGTAAPYRTCQTFAVMVAFVLMLVANSLRWKQAVPILLCFVCLYQATHLNYLFTLNQLRYQEEAAVINKIGQDIESSYDTSKPVVFVGGYEYSDRIAEQTQVIAGSGRYELIQGLSKITGLQIEVEGKFPDTNVNSVLNWSASALGNGYMMNKLFEFHGYDLNVTNNYYEDVKRYEQLNAQSKIPAYPRDGYIVELADLIIVKLG